MKKKYLMWVVLFILLSIACCYKYYDLKIMEDQMEVYYTIEDFQNIKIGESTLRDVNKIAPTKSVMATSYGGVCKYPMKDGKYIYIKLYGEEHIVGDIEVK